MANSKNILLAALGGAVIAALIAASLTSKKHERFPLSPSNNLDKLPDTDSGVMGNNNKLNSISEREDVLQPS